MKVYRQLLTTGLSERGWRVRCRTAPLLLGRLALGPLAGRGGSAAKWLGYLDQFLLFPPLLWLEQIGRAHV